MLPFGTEKLTSRRTTWSSKANDTLSNTTAGCSPAGTYRLSTTTTPPLSTTFVFSMFQ